MKSNHLLLSLSFLILTACGGGGGGGGGGSSAPTSTGSSSSSSSSSSSGGFTLSGTITLPETAAVDSDSNDSGQPGWQNNNSEAQAQNITAPVDLLGTVNFPNTGPAGKNYSSGDILDVFKTTLVAGQVIELSFADDASLNDVDLLLEDAGTQAIVGRSDGRSSKECLSVTRSGDYYIGVYTYKGAALYNLRISAPGEGSSCSNGTTSTQLFAEGQLVSQARAPKASASNGLSTLSTAAATDSPPPKLMPLPSRQALLRLGIPDYTRSGQVVTLSSTQSTTSSALQQAIDTLVYAKRLQDSGDYEYVEPNFTVELQATTSYAPNDPYLFTQKWHYQQINQPAAIDRILAMGSLPTTYPLVAVIDSGIVADHPDLKSHIIDGYSFVAGGGGINVDGANDPSTRTDNPPWHGTHVAGTIAAIDNNSAFGGGVAPMARLMPLRVFRPTSIYTTTYDVAQAIRYAAGLSNDSGRVAARKADVINMSLSGQGVCPAQYQNVIDAARAQNVIVIAAAGNDASNSSGVSAPVGNPANCNGVISVGALDALKRQTTYSNSGASLSLAAPGGDSSQTTTGRPDGIYSTIGSFNSAGVRIPSFDKMDGTSMATPHVAGVAALMRYVYPSLTPAQFDTLLALGRLTDDLGTTGHDSSTGYGLINARKAVEEALALANNTSTAPAGLVVAAPASFTFGNVISSAVIALKPTAATNEVVTAITSSSAAVTVSANSNVNAGTKLGDYLVSVDRNKLAVGTSYPTLTVTTSLRSFTVRLSVTKLASGASVGASYGRVVVQIKNADTGEKIKQLSFTPSNGKYSWSIPGIPAGNISIVAGTNLDGDGYFCDRGEACGRYPDAGQVIVVSADRNKLDFTITPTGTITSSSTAEVGAQEDEGGIPEDKAP